jgi:Carbohydrate-selective porin, OprB family/S-layer homology domain
MEKNRATLSIKLVNSHELKSLPLPWWRGVNNLFRLAVLFSFFGGTIAPPTLAEILPSLPEDEESTLEIEPIPSVSQLRDVLPTDWAYSALENLAENYQCLVGFDDSTYLGQKNLSRAEFAVMLNACLEKITKTSQVEPKDIPTVEQLRQEFTLDLALLRGKTDAIQARVQDLEATEFSDTVKLKGLVNFAVTDVLAGKGEEQIVWQQRVRLDLDRSFMGKDRLRLRLMAGNGSMPQLADGTSEVVQTQQFFGDTSNQLKITNLTYSLEIAEGLYLTTAAIGGLHSDYNLAPINPFLDDGNRGTTTLSVFGQKNAIESLGGGTGLGLIYQYNDSFSIGVGYYAANGFDATEGKGLFDGTQTTGVKLRWQANKDFTVSFNYQHGYFGKGDFAFDSNGKVFGFASNLGTAVVNDTLAQFPTIANSYGGEFFWRVNPHFGVGGWVGYTQAEAIDRGDGEIWNYAISLVFPDLGKEGNLGGIIFGAQPYLASFTGDSHLNNDTPFHLEMFYRYQLLNNISVTSGLTWQLAPNQNADNADILMGTVRVNFGF